MMPKRSGSSAPASSKAGAGAGTDLPPALRLYVVLIVTITVLTALALVYYHFTSRALEAQLWTSRTDNYGDFWHYRKLFEVFHTEAFFESADRFAYPAPCAVLYAMLYHSGPRPHSVFDLLTLLIFCASGFMLYRLLIQCGLRRKLAIGVTALMMLTSYPWHTLYDRGNLELFVYVFLATGVWAFLKGRNSPAAILWACAGTLKIYPLILLAVFFRRRTLRPLLIGILTFAGVLLVSFWFVGPTIRAAALGSMNGVFGFLGNYASSARKSELNLDHSILGAMKEILSLHMFGSIESWPNLSKIYQVSAVLVGAALFFAYIRKLPVLNQLCLLLIAIVLLPPVSYDYTLIHTYLVLGIVLAAYFYALHLRRPFPGATAYAIAFALLATAQTWIQFRGFRGNGVIKCGALLVICWLLLRFPLRTGSTIEQAYIL